MVIYLPEPGPDFRTRAQPEPEQFFCCPARHVLEQARARPSPEFDVILYERKGGVLPARKGEHKTKASEEKRVKNGEGKQATFREHAWDYEKTKACLHIGERKACALNVVCLNFAVWSTKKSGRREFVHITSLLEVNCWYAMS